MPGGAQGSNAELGAELTAQLRAPAEVLESEGLGSGVVEQLVQILGSANVLHAADACRFYGMDVFAVGDPPSAVLRPASGEQLAACVQLLAPLGIAMIARGAGLSYTDAYLVKRQPSVLVDFSAMNQSISVHAEDGYVIVDAGVSWSQLDAALQPLGVRTPYWGPLSGLYATVGGALSQGSTFLGSAQFGAAADSVLGLELVLADGSLMRTGSWSAGSFATPFLRHFGPDLTGLFLGDAGSLGFKVRASLKLIPRPSHSAFLSFEFDSFAALANAMSKLARSGQASEVFAFDPVLAQKRMQRASVMSDVKSLAQVVRKQGVLEGLKIAVAGRRFLDLSRHSAHVCFDGDSQLVLNERLSLWRRALGELGREIDSAIPKVLRSQPFTAPNSILGPNGERWVPVHGIVPHSLAPAAQAALSALFAKHADAIAQHQIEIGYLYTVVGAQGFLLEPVFYWPDARTEFHERVVEPALLARLSKHAAAPGGYATVQALKRAAADCLRAMGASHFQMGKFYRYRAHQDASSLRLIDALKQALDPRGVLNPGALL